MYLPLFSSFYMRTLVFTTNNEGLVYVGIWDLWNEVGNMILPSQRLFQFKVWASIFKMAKRNITGFGRA